MVDKKMKILIPVSEDVFDKVFTMMKRNDPSSTVCSYDISENNLILMNLEKENKEIVLFTPGSNLV